MTAANRTPRSKSTDTEQTNPTTTENDSNVTEGGRAVADRDSLDPNRPGFHCGYCGKPVGPEGQHWDDVIGEVVESQHAGTLVVADSWPENQKSDATE